MKNFKLSNGVSVEFAGRSKAYSVCLSVNVGHVNEPLKGIAALFEKTLLLQVKGVIPVFGGTMTAYRVSGDDLEETLATAAQVFNATVINEEFVEKAKAEIVEQTQSNAKLTMRRMKLLYKHTAFGADWVVSPEEYLDAIRSYTVEDIRNFANTYYTGSNVVVVIAMPENLTVAVKETIKSYFGEIPAGVKLPKIKGDIYTGGYGFMTGEPRRIMLGWDINKLTIDDSPAVNVMMTIFKDFLENAYAEATEIMPEMELKIAGYYGLRTIRVTVGSYTLDTKTLTDILIRVVNRICDEDISDGYLESMRSTVMNEKLDKHERTDDKVLETAWQLIGRGSMYDTSNRIMEISRIHADDVREISCKIFRGCLPTYVVAAPSPSESDVYGFEEVVGKLGVEDLLDETD